MEKVVTLPSSTQQPKTLIISTLQRTEKNKSNKKESSGNKIAEMDKKKCVEIRLYTGNDDLKKTWFIEYYVTKGVTKIRKQVKGGINRGKTVNERRAIAARLMDAIEREINPAVVSGYGQNTLKKKLSDALAVHCTGLRKKTRESYTSKLNTFLDWCDKAGIVYAGSFTPERAKEFFTYLKNTRKLHNTTIENYRERLKPLYTEGVGGGNPFKDIKPIKGEVTPAKPYQKHQIEILKNYISENEPQLWLFIQFIIYCLIRPNSELRILKIHHIDFENGLLVVPSEISKNKKTQWVKIPRVLLAQLDFLKQYPPHYHIFSKKGKPDIKPASYNYFYNHHRKILDALNMYVKGFNLYSYKHYGAVSMARKKVPLLEIKEQGRWHSLDQMTDYLKAFGVNDLNTINDIELV